MDDAALIGSIAALLAKNGCDAEPIRVQPWTGGGNNRLFIVTAGGTKIVAKWYYADEADRRNRLHAEWSFINYARNAGIACVPRPMAQDPAKRLALYEFIEGRKLSAKEIGRPELKQAVSFFHRLNEPAVLARARELAAASDACFSIAEHFALVDFRLGRLKKLVPESEIEHEMSLLVSDINRAWERHKTKIEANLKDNSLMLDDSLEPQDRCVSPSDFGFHNALIRDGGELCFLDFEYAGWDDPAKMVADFFYQPAVPIDPAHFEYFIDATLGRSARAERMKWRALLLRPIFRIKWCCILLNIFVAELANRMRFANPNLDVAKCKHEQLQKARMAFARLLN
jgi:hypothetical protein